MIFEVVTVWEWIRGCEVAREASAREIITAAAELLDSDSDTVRFGMKT
jgi:hypothetical protein